MESQSISAEENRMANPMELSEEIQSSGSRKRKADDGGSTLESSDDLEDDGVVDMVGYDEKQGGDPEESDVSSREEGQEWDVDSFDDGFDYRPKRNLDPNDELGQKMHRYRSQMYRSKGFDVDRENDPGNVAYRPLGPIDLDKPFKRTGLTGREFMHDMVALALERYNRIKGSTVTCEHIVRAIVALVSGVKSYITFMAREVPDGDLVEYQAKTEQRVWQRKPHAIFCRPAPKPKDPADDDFVYTDSSSDVEDSDVSSRGSGQEWDVDSLDDKPEYKLPRVNIPSDDEVEKMRLYRPKMHKSKGFNVDGECYAGRMLYFSPVDLDENLCPYKITGRQYMQNMVGLALESYNKIKGSTVTCEYIVRANLTNVGGFKSYITFMAREVPGGDLVEYQAKTEKKFSQKKAHAIFCRPSPKPKEDMAIDSRIVLTELELLKKSLGTLPLDIEESSSSC